MLRGVVPQLPLIAIYLYGISLCAQKAYHHRRVSSLVLPAILIHGLLVTVAILAQPVLLRSELSIRLYMQYAQYGMPLIIGICWLLLIQAAFVDRDAPKATVTPPGFPPGPHP